jgi:hypothetical protein
LFLNRSQNRVGSDPGGVLVEVSTMNIADPSHHLSAFFRDQAGSYNERWPGKANDELRRGMAFYIQDFSGLNRSVS